MSAFSYQGTELDLFAQATNWKAYWASVVAPYLTGDVLEVGAGIGSNTVRLRDGRPRRWVCLEPDPALSARLIDTLRQQGLESRCEARTGTLQDLEPDASFDAILYIDVLEHIAADREEVAAAADRLRRGGCVVVLSPAHQSLYTPFDAAIGHHRRYTRATLAALTPPGLRVERLIYLDAVGLLASLANRLLLRQAQPTPGQIAFWDRVMVPCSRRLDGLVGHALGKSVLGVWRKG